MATSTRASANFWDDSLRRKTPVRPIRKRCRVCKRVGYYGDRAAVCYFTRGLLGSYCCGGRLDVVVPLKKKREEVPVSEGERVRAEAVKKRDHAQRLAEARRREVMLAVKKADRLSKAMRRWEAKASYYARRANVTDAEITVERERRKQRPEKKIRRVLKMGGEL